MSISNLLLNRRQVFRRFAQSLVLVLGISAAVGALVAFFPESISLNQGLTLWIAPLILTTTLAIIVWWELRAMNRDYGLSILPPAFGTLRSRNLEGSGRFLSLLELSTKFRWRRGGIFVGRPIKPHRLFGLFNWIRVGPPDDRHFITIAGNRSGKGTAALIPNLLTYDGSALVIDPKGELAQITSARRGNGGGRVKKGLGQSVFTVDPEGIVDKNHTACWNPLDELELGDPFVLDKINRITFAIIPKSESGDNSSYFIGQARDLFSSLILHTLEIEPAENQNLIFVRELIAQGDKELHSYLAEEAQQSGNENPYDDAFEALLEFMASNSTYSAEHVDKISGTAKRLARMAHEERSGVVNQLSENTNFLDLHSMKRILQSSDFKISQLMTSPTTVYICLKGTSMSTDLCKILTIFVDLAIGEFENTDKKPELPVLFAMDEFYSLGYLKAFDTGIGLIAGYGVKLWPVLQHLSQLKRLYPTNWENFLGNCGTIQLFGDVDSETVDYVATKRIGEAVYRRPDGSTERQPLLTPNELSSSFFNRESRRQLVLFHQEPAAMLELMDYYKFFPKRMYNDDRRSR